MSHQPKTFGGMVSGYPWIVAIVVVVALVIGGVFFFVTTSRTNKLINKAAHETVSQTTPSSKPWYAEDLNGIWINGTDHYTIRTELGGGESSISRWKSLPGRMTTPTTEAKGTFTISGNTITAKWNTGVVSQYKIDGSSQETSTLTDPYGVVYKYSP